MEAFIERTITKAALKYPIDVKLDTQEELNNNIDAFLEAVYHDDIEDIPDDFDLDWIDVLNYINEAYEYTELYVEFPLCRIQLYNQFIFSILKTNQEVLFQSIHINLPNCK
jgi:hypothetical protein